jgi:hypothetical protein
MMRCLCTLVVLIGKIRSIRKKDLNTSEALITLLHLSQIKAVKNESLDWLQKRVETKTLYNGYSMTGKVTDYNQSAANYAISAMIFSEADKKDVSISNEYDVAKPSE